MVGVVFVCAAIGAGVAAMPPQPRRVAVADARPDPEVGVVLTGGTWDCAAAIPRDAQLTVDAVSWVPLRAGMRTVLVAFTVIPACDALPRESAGVLTRVSEPAYETLREHDLARWAAVPQATLSFLFPRQPSAALGPLVAAVVLAITGIAILVWRWR